VKKLGFGSYVVKCPSLTFRLGLRPDPPLLEKDSFVISDNFVLVKLVPGIYLKIALRPGTDVMILKNIFAEKLGKKIGVFDSKQS
jgi:hypothetical protein